MNDELKRAAAEMGKKGGLVKGGRKAEAPRENGKKGGRPPADIDDRLRRDVLKAEARAGKETGWTIGDWSIYR